MNLRAFFYPADLAIGQLVRLIQGIATDEALDLVDFPEEMGGSANQQLAIPLLAGMDEIEVVEAQITLQAVTKELEIEDFQVTNNGDSGAFLSLPTAARLKKVDLSYQLPSTVDAAQVRLVVRAATPAGSGFQAGVPLFSSPDFGKPGAMYEPVLGGMTLASFSGNRRVITLPGVLGSAWLIQLATGDEATKLQALAVTPTVNRVVLDAAPRNLSVVLMGSEGEVLLWNNPQALLPAAGQQLISFTPLARRHLSASLKRATGSQMTLPIPLQFRSDSGGTIRITTSSLKSQYIVKPLGEAPTTLRLGGDLTSLELSAPALLTPSSSTMRLTARLHGRELNAASPASPLQPSVAGLRLVMERSLATAVQVAPLPGQAPGSLLELASARILIMAREDAELVLEVRGDVAGSPGPVAAPPEVRQVAKDFSGWLEFELTKPLEVVAGQAPLWLALRTNRGVVYWFCAGAGPGESRISSDRGESWGAPEPRLIAQGFLLAQLFHRVPDPQPVPVLRLQHGETVMMENLFSTPTRISAREFVLGSAGLPGAVHDFLAGRLGQGRVSSTFQLFSRSVLDLTVENLAIRYDPFQAASGS
ncbi:MAG: hypothetical protein R3310_11440 [Candidatus Competibacteraceae bacterium]|nr:hypothetical protein [Candidatus Competibacteraceae bacterium]